MKLSSSRKGFTLIEIMLSVAVISGLIVAGTSAFYQVVSRVAVANAEETFQSSVRRAQTLARNQSRNSNWGVYLDQSETQLIIYAGTSYAERNTALDEIVRLDGAVDFSDNDGLDINFAQLTGEPTPPLEDLEVSFSSAGISRSIQTSSVLGNTENIINCPEGYIPVPNNPTYNTGDFCVMKYEAKDVGGVATSQAADAPWANISQVNALAACQSLGSGYDLLSNDEWMTIARNLEQVGLNWTDGTPGSGVMYRGHADNSPPNALAATTDDSDGYFGTGNSPTLDSVQRRTLLLSNGETIWDFAGNVFHLLRGSIVGDDKPSAPGATGTDFTVRNWTEVTLYGGLSYDLIRPSNTAWGTSFNTGTYYKGNAGSSTYSVRRGGRWSSWDNAGIYAMTLGGSVNDAQSENGFRCSYK